LLLDRDSFIINNDNCVAICGAYFGLDNVHVGLYWSDNGEKKIIHFINGQNIPVTTVNENSFANYHFNKIEDFPEVDIPSIAAFTELLADASLNNFVFQRIGVLYDGGKFERQTGEFKVKTPVEKYINCAVFVIGLLNTYDYQLIDWSTWPNADRQNLVFLDEWLNTNNVPLEEREKFYEMTKEIRGKHVLVSPDSATKPAPFLEVELPAHALIHFFNLGFGQQP
jgi:hypothetical protein